MQEMKMMQKNKTRKFKIDSRDIFNLNKLQE